MNALFQVAADVVCALEMRGFKESSELANWRQKDAGDALMVKKATESGGPVNSVYCWLCLKVYCN